MQTFVKVDAPVVALTHVRVIDGTGAAAREDQTIILSNGKIEWVGDASAANVPKDAQVLDLHGYSVIPGLVGHARPHVLSHGQRDFRRDGVSAFRGCTLPAA